MNTFIMGKLKPQIAQCIEASMKTLLSEKHLYQSIDVNLGEAYENAYEYMKRLTESKRNSSAPIDSRTQVFPPSEPTSQVEEIAALLWQPMASPSIGVGVAPALDRGSDHLAFQLPTINTFCSHCEASWPFNPICDSQLSVNGSPEQQWFFLGYQCQQCKGLPIRFLVRRDGLKLRLAGRDPIECLPIPKVLPKRPAKYFSDAFIAHHAGQTLAGLFLLRVFVEQYWRTIPAVQAVLKIDPRATGERQGDAYQTTLPSDFKERFPSLKELYGKLSEAIHAADANATVFDEVAGAIVKHFDARRVFEFK